MLLDFQGNINYKTQELICEATRLTLKHFPAIDTEGSVVTFEVTKLRGGSTGDMLNEDDGEFNIRLAAGQDPVELQRTVAHEITHVIQYLRGDDLSDRGDYFERQHEVEAFATEELLYPTES